MPWCVVCLLFGLRGICLSVCVLPTDSDLWPFVNSFIQLFIYPTTDPSIYSPIILCNVHPSIYSYFHLFLLPSTHTSIFSYFHLFILLSMHTSSYSYVRLFVHQFILPPIHTSTYSILPSIHTSIYSHFHLFMQPSIYPRIHRFSISVFIHNPHLPFELS